jgi:hypothetical protein
MENECLSVSDYFFQKAIPLIVFMESFCSHQTMLAVDYIELSIFEDWLILRCDFKHMILWVSHISFVCQIWSCS